MRNLLWLICLALVGCASMSGGPAKVTNKAVPPAVAEASASAAAEPPPPPPKAVDIPPDVMFDLLVAEIAVQRGQYDMATQYYLELAHTLRDPRMAETATRLAVYAQDKDSAVTAAKLWADLDPKSVQAREMATVFYIRNGQLDLAQHELEEILAISPDNDDNMFMLIASLLGSEQDKEAALQVMDRLIASRPGDVMAWLAYAQLAVRTGDLDKAEMAVKRAAALEPDRVEVIVEQARILLVQNKTEDALALMEASVKKNPKNTALRASYARLLVDDKQFTQAYDQFKLVDKERPNDPSTLFALGILAVELKQVDEGERDLLKVHGMNGDFVAESAFYLGRIAEEVHKDDSAAIKWYSEVKSGPNYLDAQTHIALIMAQKGNVDAALDRLRSMDLRDPDQALQVYLVEGDILGYAERRQEALEIYDAALEEFPDNSELLYARAMVEEKLDRLNDMEDDLKFIIAHEPDNANALNALGYTLADRTQRYDEALGYIQRALQLDPNSHYILDSMGWVNYRLGHYDEAEKYLKRAMEVDPEPEIAAHLVEVLWVKGDKQQARVVWKQAMDASPDDKTLQEVMARLNPK